MNGGRGQSPAPTGREKTVYTRRKLRTRKIVRLAAASYRGSGMYFVTICTYLHQPLLGRFENNQMILTESGHQVSECWSRLGQIYPDIVPGSYVVMPNHFRGVLSIVKTNDGANACMLDLVQVIRNFKAYTARQHYLLGVQRKLWQRSFFERVVRDEYDRRRIERYIKSNQKNWIKDKYYLTN